MRAAMAMVLATALAFGSVPGAAQSLNDMGQLKTMTPLPDLKGNDPDLICFAVMASAANGAKKSGKPDTLLESAAGYYAGRLAIRYPDSGSTLRPWVAKLLNQSSNDSAVPFHMPCLQRYGVQLMGLMTALQGGTADAK